MLRFYKGSVTCEMIERMPLKEIFNYYVQAVKIVEAERREMERAQNG